MTGLKLFLFKFSCLLAGWHIARPFSWFVTLGSNVPMAVVLNMIWMLYSVTMILKHLLPGKIQWLGQGTDERLCLFPSFPFAEVIWLMKKEVCWKSRQKSWCFCNGSEDSRRHLFPIRGYFYEKESICGYKCTAIVGAGMSSREAEKLRLLCLTLSLHL